jgi:hypothetical protein
MNVGTPSSSSSSDFYPRPKKRRMMATNGNTEETEDTEAAPQAETPVDLKALHGAKCAIIEFFTSKYDLGAAENEFVNDMIWVILGGHSEATAMATLEKLKSHELAKKEKSKKSEENAEENEETTDTAEIRPDQPAQKKLPAQPDQPAQKKIPAQPDQPSQKKIPAQPDQPAQKVQAHPAQKFTHKPKCRTRLTDLADVVRSVNRELLPPASTASISQPQGNDLYMFQLEDQAEDVEDGFRWCRSCAPLWLHENVCLIKRKEQTQVTITYETTKDTSKDRIRANRVDTRVIGTCDIFGAYVRSRATGKNQRNSKFQKYKYVFEEEKVIAIHYVGDHTILE